MVKLARNFIVGFALCLIAGGCHKAPTLVGDWELYAAISAKPGAMTFTDHTFRQSFKEVMFGVSLDMSGTYTLDGGILHLSPTSVAAASGGHASNVSDMNKPVDFKVDWNGSDLVYLTYDSGSVKNVMALARNGAKPDMKRIDLNIDTSKGLAKGEGFTVTKTDNGQTSPTTGGMTQPQTANTQAAPMPTADQPTFTTAQPPAQPEQQPAQPAQDPPQPTQQQPQTAPPSDQPTSGGNSQPDPTMKGMPDPPGSTGG